MNFVDTRDVMSLLEIAMDSLKDAMCCQKWMLILSSRGRCFPFLDRILLFLELVCTGSMECSVCPSLLHMILVYIVGIKPQTLSTWECCSEEFEQNGKCVTETTVPRHFLGCSHLTGLTFDIFTFITIIINYHCSNKTAFLGLLLIWFWHGSWYSVRNTIPTWYIVAWNAMTSISSLCEIFGHTP